MGSRSHPRGFVIAFLATVIAFSAFFGALSVYLEGPSGDLARLGHWPERDFGWHSQQPPVFRRANGSAVPAPRILVLGDSFSRSNLWQSFLSSGDGEIQSYYYPEVGCISNWAKWASRKPYRSSTTVLIETVEREYVVRFAYLRFCAASKPRAFELAAGPFQAERSFLPLTTDVAFLWETAMNASRSSGPQDRFVSGPVVNLGLTTGRFFSNRRSDRLLFYREDEDKRLWTQEELDAAAKNLKDIQQRFERAGVHMVMIVIPDKSTTYGPWLRSRPKQGQYQTIMAGLAAGGVHAIDVLAEFRRKLPGTVDLYYPDDTHLSPTGYRLLASAIAERLGKEGQVHFDPESAK